MVSASTDQTIKLWKIGCSDQALTLKGHNDVVISLSFSLDGRTLASGGYDRRIRLWRMREYVVNDNLLLL